MMDFDEFDKQVNLNDLTKDISELVGSTISKEVVAGEYEVTLDSIKLEKTKNGNPRINIQFRIQVGDFTNQCVWFSRVMWGTKNDPMMIANVIEFLKSLDSQIETPITFTTFANLQMLIVEIEEKIKYDKLHFIISYKPKGFNTVTILEVLE